MKLVVLNGASCSGKTTVIKNIMKEKENYFQLSYDSFKWQFSKYVSGKYYKDIHEIMLSVLGVLCRQKHNVVCEAYHEASRNRFIKLAKDQGYEIVEINFEAEWDVLLRRFDKRLTEAESNPEIKMANRSPERFKELYEIYQREKNPQAITLRTDVESIEQITQKVFELL